MNRKNIKMKKRKGIWVIPLKDNKRKKRKMKIRRMFWRKRILEKSIGN
jgi:hypothetical protein